MTSSSPYFDIFPRIVPAGSQALVTVRPLFDHARFHPGEPITAALVPLEGLAREVRWRDIPRQLIQAQDGALQIPCDFPTEQEYLLTVEIPGVNEKDVAVDISGNTMTIKGEKKQEKEEKDKNYYRIERSYGSFQRVLSLPEDVNQEGVKAGFKNGVLSITMPRKALPKGEVKQIQITSDT